MFKLLAMKAIEIDNFVANLSDLKPKSVQPPIPKSAREIRVKVTHAAVTHVDLLYAQGLHQNNKRHVKPPFILGTEFSGIVIDSPADSSFQPGMRVFGAGLGSYAEEICVNEESLRMVPEQWTNAEACAVGASGAVSYGALISVAQLRAGETALILGASGGLGVMAVQISKAVGAKVIAVVGDQEKADLVKRIGADFIVNYHDANWEEKARALTDSKEGVDVVYDGIGAVESGLKCLRYRGRLVIVGFAARQGNIENIRVNRILLKSVTVHGYRFGEDGRRDARRTKEVWDGFMGLVKLDGRIKPVVYNERYEGLKSLPRALCDAREHRVWGRAVLTISEAAEAKGGFVAKL